VLDKFQSRYGFKSRFEPFWWFDLRHKETLIVLIIYYFRLISLSNTIQHTSCPAPYTLITYPINIRYRVVKHSLLKTATVIETNKKLTLTRQRGRCRNIKGEPQIFGNFRTPRPSPFFPLVVILLLDLGQPQLHAKFEVASFSRCTNIKGEPKILGSSYSTGPRPLFRPCGILWWTSANPSSMPILKLLALPVAEILQGNPEILGSSPSPRPHPLFLQVRFYDGSWQTQAVYQIWTH